MKLNVVTFYVVTFCLLMGYVLPFAIEEKPLLTALDPRDQALDAPKEVTHVRDKRTLGINPIDVIAATAIQVIAAKAALLNAVLGTQAVSYEGGHGQHHY